MTYKDLGLCELDELLAEIRAVYTETDLNSKEDLLNSLNTVKVGTLARNNLYEMKIVRAKQVAGNKYRCEFVRDITDNDNCNYVILNNIYAHIKKVEHNTVYIGECAMFSGNLQLDLSDLICGASEDLAWLNYYNEHLTK